MGTCIGNEEYDNVIDQCILQVGMFIFDDTAIHNSNHRAVISNLILVRQKELQNDYLLCVIKTVRRNLPFCSVDLV